MQRYGLSVATLELLDMPYATPQCGLQISPDRKRRGIRPIIRSSATATLLSAICGFMHFLRWNAQFQTKLKGSLWRFAAVPVML